jgi:hypothetical protein
MCQTFVENIVDINGLTANIIDNTTRIALKPQDAKALIATLGSRSDIVKHVTDLGGKVDKWVFDHKIVWKKPMIKEFALVGNMHVKTVDDVADNNIDEILKSSADTVVINGMTDTIVENVDDVFNAAVALEEDDKKTKRNQMIITIVGIIVFIILIGTAAVIIFFIWKRRKGLLKCSVFRSKVLQICFR